MVASSLTPLPINTGGNLPHDQVVGPDSLMATVLEKLGNQSVIIGAERRMGKTSLLRKLEAEANDEAFVICYRSVENTSSPTEFVEAIIEMVGRRLSPRHKIVAPDDAIILAKRLLLGKTVATDTIDAVAARMAEAVEGVPFYIHHLAAGVVEQFGRTASVPTSADVDALLEKAVLDPADPWQLAHYVTRLKDYFEQDHEVVAIILDLIAQSENPIGFDDLTKQLHAKKAKTPSDDDVRALLDLLERDHYLVKAGAGRVRFRLDIIRKAWRAKRYLDR